MKRSSSWFAVLPSLVIPVCIGMMLYLAVLVMIEQKFIADEMVLRYLIGHPVSKVTVAMFLIGLASLMGIGFDVLQQFSAEKRILLEVTDADPDAEISNDTNRNRQSESPSASGNESTFELRASLSRETSSASSAASEESENPIVRHAIACGQSMLALPRSFQAHYLWERIVNALHSVYRTGTASNVEEELKYLADLDTERQQQRYSLVQILIWATPMLGFLGTVLGISQALGGISVGPDNDFQTMMDGLRGSLYVAFDTTGLALTLSMFLMFGQFLVERFESQLLQLVDGRARAEIAGQFDLSSNGNADLQTAQLERERTAQLERERAAHSELIEALKSNTQSQTEIWRKSIRAAEKAWLSSLADVGGEVQSRFHVALDESVSSLAHYLSNAIEKADQSMSHRWEQWQVLLSDNARSMSGHQTHLAEQTNLIHQMLQKTGDINMFESALAKNDEAIAQTTRLREALAELTTAFLDSKKSVEREDVLDPPQSVDLQATKIALANIELAKIEPVETESFVVEPEVSEAVIVKASNSDDVAIKLAVIEESATHSTEPISRDDNRSETRDSRIDQKRSSHPVIKNKVAVEREPLRQQELPEVVMPMILSFQSARDEADEKALANAAATSSDRLSPFARKAA